MFKIFKKYQFVWHQFIVFRKFTLYYSIQFYKPHFCKRYFVNSSDEDIYEWSFWIGWLEIKKRRNKE
jgi:hypothetical protein